MSTSTRSEATSASTAMQRRARLASFIGTTIEWYDFYLYGTTAALVFSEIFFTSYSGTLGTIMALLTFSAGFIARPLGGIVMGHFGDRVGRKTLLIISMLIMGLATALIGVLPSYASIGVAAPIILVVLRVIQGFGVGGEWGGAVLVAVEHAPAGRRGIFGAWPQMGVPLGLLLANAVFLTSQQSMSHAAFLTWGWRIGFLCSVILIAAGLVIRLKMEETPEFQRTREQDQVVRFPVVEMFKRQWRTILVAIGIKLSQNSIFYIITVFALTYVTSALGLPESTALVGVLIACVISCFSLRIFGWLSDEFGRRRIYLIGAITSGAFAFPFFMLMDTRNAVVIWLAIVVALIFHDMMYGPQAAYMSELFDANVRYTGASFGYQFATMIAGAVSPVLAVALLNAADQKAWPIALYIIGMSVLTLIATIAAPETHRGNKLTAATGRQSPPRSEVSTSTEMAND